MDSPAASSCGCATYHDGTFHLCAAHDDRSPAPCTCTLACIPQGITGEQTCRLDAHLSTGRTQPLGRIDNLGYLRCWECDPTGSGEVVWSDAFEADDVCEVCHQPLARLVVHPRG